MKVDACPDFPVAYITTDRYEIEIDEDGDVALESDCVCGHWCQIPFSLDELAEIVRQATAFCAARAERAAPVRRKKGGGNEDMDE